MKNKTSLSDIFFSKVRQRVLGLLYGQLSLDFHTNEIIRLTQMGTGAVQRELNHLILAGLIKVKQVGNQKRYQADQDMPLFEELHSIILKTFGLADVLRDALNPVEKHILFSFIYGSIARREDTAASDIDLILIGAGLTYAEVFRLLEKPEAQLGRKINPIFYSPEEWALKSKEGNHFIKKISQQPKIFLIGTEDELSQFSKDGSAQS